MKTRLMSICTLIAAGIMLGSVGAFAADQNAPSSNTDTGANTSQSANQPGTAASNEPGTAGNMNQGNMNQNAGQPDQNVQPGQAPGTAASPSGSGY